MARTKNYEVFYHCGIRAPQWRPCRHADAMLLTQRGEGQQTGWTRAGVQFEGGVFLAPTPVSVAAQGEPHGSWGKGRKVFAVKVPHGVGLRCRFDGASEVIVTSAEDWAKCEVLGEVSAARLRRFQDRIRPWRALCEWEVERTRRPLTKKGRARIKQDAERALKLHNQIGAGMTTDEELRKLRDEHENRKLRGLRRHIGKSRLCGCGGDHTFPTGE